MIKILEKEILELLLEKNFWGKGFGALAWQMMTKYAFNTLNLDVIETKIFTSNESSLRVAEKIGFKKEIVIKDIVKDGKNIDRIILELKEIIGIKMHKKIRVGIIGCGSIAGLNELDSYRENHVHISAHIKLVKM